MTFKIENKVPIPESAKHNRQKYPFDSMSVGDSFFVSSSISKVNTVRRITVTWQHKLGMKFATSERTEDGVHGTRIWRIK